MPELSPPYDQMTTEELLALFQGPPRPTPEQIAAENELIASYTAYVDAKPEPLSQPTPTSPVNTPDALTASAPFPFLDSSHRRILPSPKNSSHLLVSPALFLWRDSQLTCDAQNSTDHLEARPESGPSTSGISLNASVAIQQGGVPERVVDWGEAGGHEGGQQKVIKREEGGQSRVRAGEEQAMEMSSQRARRVWRVLTVAFPGRQGRRRPQDERESRFARRTRSVPRAREVLAC